MENVSQEERDIWENKMETSHAEAFQIVKDVFARNPYAYHAPKVLQWAGSGNSTVRLEEPVDGVTRIDFRDSDTVLSAVITVDTRGWDFSRSESNLGYGTGINKPTARYGFKRLVWDVCFGYVSGFRLRDIFYYMWSRSISGKIFNYVSRNGFSDKVTIIKNGAF